MSQLTADLSLLLVTLVWGSTFVVVKDAISTMGPLTFVAVRFLVAGATLMLWGIAREVRLSPTPGASVLRELRSVARGGIIAGLALFFSYATQTLGLMTVSAGKAAFITGLYVAIVPAASRAVLRSAPDRNSIFGVALATAGLGLMSLKLPLDIAPGDILVLFCAVGFAAHILLVGRYSGHGDPVFFTAVQLGVVSAGSWLCAAVVERPIMVPAGAWGAILFTALAGTSLAFLTQSAVQRFTSATHTALIFSAEPVFGAVFAWILAGEVLSAREVVGAACILAGMLVSEWSAFPSRATSGGR